MNSILGIIFNYPNPTKKEIKLEIEKLLTPIVDYNTFFIYETNITDIPIITTNLFNITTNSSKRITCLFKKNNNKDKLLLLCLATTIGEMTLGQIDEMTLDDINIIYNFTIAATYKEDRISVVNIGSSILLSVYPTEIDFNKKDSFNIIYETEYPQMFFRFILDKNASSPDLFCYDSIGAKVCTVYQSHFSKSGDYYTYYGNSLGELTISYELPTIKVILNENRKNEGDNSSSSYAGVIAGSIIGAIVLIALIILLIWCYKKKFAKNDNNDNENVEEKSTPLKDQHQVELKEKIEEEPKEIE